MDMDKELEKAEEYFQALLPGPPSKPAQYRPRHLPSVLQAFPTLRRGKLQLRVRIVQYPTEATPILDIREFITSAGFNGFSKKGITLDLAQFKELVENQELIIKALGG